MAIDQILYHAHATAQGDVVFKPIVGAGAVRSGYGTPRLVGLRALYAVNTGGNRPGVVHVFVRNSNWVRNTEVNAAEFKTTTALSEDSSAYESGRRAKLTENSTFDVTGHVGTWTPGTGGFIDCFLIVDIDYESVPANDVPSAMGFPVTFTTSKTGMTIQPNVLTPVESYDFLDPGVDYLLNELRAGFFNNTNGPGAYFAVISGVQTMRGLNMIIPVKAYGEDVLVNIKSSVKFTKQAYNIGVVSSYGMAPGSVTFKHQFIASANSV